MTVYEYLSARAFFPLPRIRVEALALEEGLDLSATAGTGENETDVNSSTVRRVLGKIFVAVGTLQWNITENGFSANLSDDARKRLIKEGEALINNTSYHSTRYGWQGEYLSSLR